MAVVDNFLDISPNEQIKNELAINVTTMIDHDKTSREFILKNDEVISNFWNRIEPNA